VRTPTARPDRGATAALVLTPADVADLADALLELRAARDRLHRVDALLSRLLAEVQLRLAPESTQGPEGADLRAPERVDTDNSNATNPDAGTAQTRDAGDTCPISEEVSCPL
jgi:hypothetical protein